jgi:hypothetical protein
VRVGEHRVTVEQQWHCEGERLEGNTELLYSSNDTVRVNVWRGTQSYCRAAMTL